MTTRFVLGPKNQLRIFGDCACGKREDFIIELAPTPAVDVSAPPVDTKSASDTATSLREKVERAHMGPGPTSTVRMQDTEVLQIAKVFADLAEMRAQDTAHIQVARREIEDKTRRLAALEADTAELVKRLEAVVAEADKQQKIAHEFRDRATRMETAIRTAIEHLHGMTGMSVGPVQSAKYVLHEVLKPEPGHVVGGGVVR